MDINKAVKKLTDFLKVSFSAEEIQQLQDYTKPIVVTLSEVSTEDGKKLSYNGELKAGTEINDITSGTPVPCEGDFVLTTGETIKTAAGKIVEVIPAVQENQEQMAARKIAEAAVPQLAQMSVQLSSYKDENKALKSSLEKRISDLENKNQFLATQLQKVLAAEVDFSGSVNKEKSWEDMTAYEKYLASK